MSRVTRHQTPYPGVYYIEVEGARGKEKIFYIRYRKHGKLIEEKAGRQFQDNMTASQASGTRANRIDSKEPTNEEKRETEQKEKEREESKWTIDRLWNLYKDQRDPGSKSTHVDELTYRKHIEKALGTKEPREIIALDVDRLRRRLMKYLSPQTVKHVLNLLDRIINHGLKKGVIEQGLRFKIQKPKVNNLVTEDLSQDQLVALLKAIDADENIQIANMMRMALFTGMRRGELFKLRWEDVNLDRGFLTIRDPKGGKDQTIPLNDQVRDLLSNHPRTGDSPLVFPTSDGSQRAAIHNQVNRIRERAGLPKSFRPMHGLRHVYASMLASSGQVDMYALQKLLTHKSPLMTQRYAHLRDDVLKRASALAGNIIVDAVKASKEEGNAEEAEKKAKKIS